MLFSDKTENDHLRMGKKKHFECQGTPGHPPGQKGQLCKNAVHRLQLSSFSIIIPQQLIKKSPLCLTNLPLLLDPGLFDSETPVHYDQQHRLQHHHTENTCWLMKWLMCYKVQSKSQQFASDTPVVGLISNDVSVWKEEVNQLSEWWRNNNLSFNADKTKKSKTKNDCWLQKNSSAPLVTAHTVRQKSI